jgi:hypothetical protein
LRNQIPSDLFVKACANIIRIFQPIPFVYRGINVSLELIKFTMDILNDETSKTLPHNCRQLKRDDTPDGLDRRIKDTLQTDLRTANIISDVLEQAGIVEVIKITNLTSGREVNGTRLLKAWTW